MVSLLVRLLGRSQFRRPCRHRHEWLAPHVPILSMRQEDPDGADHGAKSWVSGVFCRDLACGLVPKRRAPIRTTSSLWMSRSSTLEEYIERNLCDIRLPARIYRLVIVDIF